MKICLRLVVICLMANLVLVACSRKPKIHHKNGQDMPHSHGMQHDFSDAEYWASRFDDPSREGWQKPAEVIRAMQIRPGMRVADIGAGTGYFLPYLSQAVGESGQVMAYEVEPNLVDYMKQRVAREQLANTLVYLIEPHNPRLKRDSLDKIIIVNTWHHISHRERYARYLADGLKPGGSVYIVDYEPGAPGPGPDDRHRMTTRQVVTELQAGGLQTEVLPEPLSYQYIVRATKKRSDEAELN